MTKDLNSNISLVEYNSLNLPSVITFSNNMDNITNIYTSTGTKLRSISSKYAYLWEDPLVDLYAPTDNQAAEPMLSVDEHPDFVVVDNDEAVAYVQEEDNALAEAADDSNDEAVISEEVVNAPSRCKRFWGNIGLEESKTTDYCANVIYQDGKRMLLVNGGYVTFNDSLSYGEGLGGACYHYYLKDHLGNIREVVDEMGNIQQVTNYYPFGTPYSDAQSTINPEFQPFKYNGKELDMMHGLNTLDYGARQYDPVLPVWDRVDPLAEKYYHISPYMYCLGNPVKLVDSDGRKVKLTNNEEDLAAIRETLPHSLREYITANDGFIDKQKMEEGLNAMGDDVSLNYKSLFEIVADDRTVEFSLLDKPHAVNASGNTPKHMITFGPTLYFEADNIGNPAEWITQGGTSISLAPKSHKWTKWDNMQRARLNEDELQFSPNENYQVQINSSMYKNNATHKNGAKAVAHELYGHILYMFRGWDSAHGSNRKVDNQKLENWLQRIGNETDYNFDH